MKQNTLTADNNPLLVRADNHPPTVRADNNPPQPPQPPRRKFIRKRGYDYSKAGFYFITINTQNKAHLFGCIYPERDAKAELILPIKGVMIYNEVGLLANQCWEDIPKHFPNVVVHTYVVMPNHMHGLIEIRDVGADDYPPTVRAHVGADVWADVWADDYPPIPPIPPLPPQRKNSKLGAIVRGLKIGITKWFRQNSDIEKVWQRDYFERIIKDQNHFDFTKNYIEQNINKWAIKQLTNNTKGRS